MTLSGCEQVQHAMLIVERTAEIAAVWTRSSPAP
jgi:hypothetical protein